jgi:hypothetical protein
MLTTPQLVTAEDHALIRPYVILPMVQAAFERDSHIFLTLRTPAPYVEWLMQVRERLAVESHNLSAQVNQRGIRITDNRRIEGKLIIRYQCRGQYDGLTIPDADVAKQAAELMRRLLRL